MPDVRLIDANALMKNIGKIPQLRGITYGRMKNAVEETPTIDAVPVVRCRKCKESEPLSVLDTDCLYFGVLDTAVHCNGYCYHGERMDGGVDDD